MQAFDKKSISYACAASQYKRKPYWLLLPIIEKTKSVWFKIECED